MPAGEVCFPWLMSVEVQVKWWWWAAFVQYLYIIQLYPLEHI